MEQHSTKKPFCCRVIEADEKKNVDWIETCAVCTAQEFISDTDPPLTHSIARTNCARRYATLGIRKCICTWCVARMCALCIWKFWRNYNRDLSRYKFVFWMNFIAWPVNECATECSPYTILHVVLVFIFASHENRALWRISNIWLWSTYHCGASALLNIF